MYVDLHMHTYYSDGTMSPEEIVIEAKKKGVGVLSITDHNRLSSWEELREVAQREGIKAIRGVEINCKYKGQVFHILAYGFEETPELLTLINKASKEMDQMSVDLVRKIEKEDGRVSVADYEKYSYNPRKGGWKGVHYLLDRQITSQLVEGFKYYRDYDCDFKDYDFPSVEDICRATKEAGGYTSLAHPGEYYKNLNREELMIELEELRMQGVQGIECYYPTHPELMTNTCVAFCKQHDLLITTGSDEHGEFGKQAKAIEQTIGCMKITLEKLNLKSLV